MNSFNVADGHDASDWTVELANELTIIEEGNVAVSAPGGKNTRLYRVRSETSDGSVRLKGAHKFAIIPARYRSVCTRAQNSFSVGGPSGR